MKYVTPRNELTPPEAEALAQFLKRVVLNDSRHRAASDDEAILMSDAAA